MRGIVALAAALAVNAGLFAMLAWLNAASETPQDEPDASLILAELPPPAPDESQPQRQPEPPQTTDREPMRVDLDTPTPETPAPEPIALNLDMHTPTPDPIRVATRGATQSDEPTDADDDEPRRPQGPVATGLRERPGNPRPAYPPRARRMGIEGTVQVRLIIGTDGRVEASQILSGHPLLREAVAKVIDQYRFDPPRKDGRPVRAQGTKPIRFELQD